MMMLFPSETTSLNRGGYRRQGALLTNGSSIRKAPAYVAAARVAQVGRDSHRPTLFGATIRPGSYLEFGRAVALESNGTLVERGLIDAVGRLDAARAGQPVRAISHDDLERILALGLITEEELLPRSDADDDSPLTNFAD